MPQPDLDSPDFPHGSQAGYVAGCKKSRYTCPATPTCNEVNNEGAQRRKADPLTGDDGRYTYFVHRRVLETLKRVTPAQLAEYAGVDTATVERWRDEQPMSKVTPEADAAPLDEAWAWFVRGNDVRDPNLTHGTGTVYNLGCRCHRCRDAATKARAKSNARRGPATVKVTRRFRKHLDELAAATGGYHGLHRSTGISRSWLTNIRNGHAQQVSVAMFAKVMALTPDDMHGKGTTPNTLVDSTRTRMRVQQLKALGYPLWWVNEQLGRKDGDTFDRHTCLRLSLVEAVDALADRIGDRAATEADGITSKQSARAKREARERGVYPPIFYDDDGNLDYRAIPDHPWSKADERCAKDFPLVYAVARGEKSAGQMVREGLTADKKYVERMRKALGISARWSEPDERSFLLPECVERAAWVRSVIDDYYAGLRGPVEVALILGIRSQVPANHPERIAFEATQPLVRTLAWVMFEQARINDLVARAATPVEFKEAA